MIAKNTSALSRIIQLQGRLEITNEKETKKIPSEPSIQYMLDSLTGIARLVHVFDLNLMTQIFIFTC